MQKPPLSKIELLEARIAPATIYAISSDNNLISFDSAFPTILLSSVAITGLHTNEDIQGMDFRPGNGDLYVLGVEDPGAAVNTGRIYTLATDTGVLTQIGSPFSTNLDDGMSYGFDFNPVVDRIRITTSNEDNFRVNPDTGAVAGTDSDLAGVTTFTAIAYDQNFAGSTTATLYGIDYDSDTLFRIGGINGTPSPNLGASSSIGALGVSAGNSFNFGLDIQTTTAGSTAFYASQFGGIFKLYTVDLATGAATSIGNIGTGVTGIRDLAVAPLISDLDVINTKTATYTDIDGDIVTIKTSAGVLDTSDFVFIPGPSGGQQLVSLNLNDDAAVAGSSITFSVKRGPGGDGLAHVGLINSDGHNLGTVTVKGDLGRIIADGEQVGKPAVASLAVYSIGVQGKLSQGGNGDLTSSIAGGSLGSMTVKTNIQDASINVTGVGGKIGKITIGGSLIGGSAANSGSISSDEDISSIKIKGNVVGGSGISSGYVGSLGKLVSMSISGSLIGGEAVNSGTLKIEGDIGTVAIGRDIVGGNQNYAGSVYSNSGNIGKVSVKGSVTGGEGFDSGLIFTLVTNKNIGTVAIGGSIHGGSNFYSGGVFSAGFIKSVSVAGSLIGGSFPISGSITSNGEMGTIKIAGDVIGGTDASYYSGSIYASNNGSIKSIFIGGSLLGGSATGRTGILSEGSIGTINIKGDVAGNGNDVIISAGGISNPTAATIVSLKSLTVVGSVIHADILAGIKTNGAPNQYSAQIGNITIGRDLVATDIAAGINPVNTTFGDSDDVIIPAGTGSIYSKIASITVKGQVFGSTNPGDRFAITAVTIGALKVNGASVVLNSDPSAFPDSFFLRSVSSNDVRIKEQELL